MRRKRSLVARRPGSPNWYENFTVNGYRFRGSLETDDRDQAEIIAAKKRSDALLGKLTGQKPELTLSQALGRYLIEHGQHLTSADDIRRMGGLLIAALGSAKPLHDITASDLATYAARRRASVSNRSVNAEMEHLRAVLARAEKLWGVAAPAIVWQKVLLEEGGQREHVLSEEEEGRLFKFLRPDYHPLVRFALITGLRLSNIIELTWKQIDWDARSIVFRVKSRKPGGELHYVPITPAVAAILSLELGNHPDRVFTYMCERSTYNPTSRVRQISGTRYPFTHDGWRRPWAKALADAEITDFRFHDLRHTAGTRALLAHKNLKTVQRMLGHKNIATTLRYTRSDVDDVRAAMEAVEAQSRHTRLVDAPQDVEKGKKSG